MTIADEIRKIRGEIQKVERTFWIFAVGLAVLGYCIVLVMTYYGVLQGIALAQGLASMSEVAGPMRAIAMQAAFSQSLQLSAAAAGGGLVGAAGMYLVRKRLKEKRD